MKKADGRDLLLGALGLLSLAIPFIQKRLTEDKEIEMINEAVDNRLKELAEQRIQADQKKEE